jgi:hypothetical protein
MMSAEINIRRQAAMLIRGPILMDKLPLSVSVHYGLDIVCGVAYLVSLSAIADFQDYTISIAAEARLRIRAIEAPRVPAAPPP